MPTTYVYNGSGSTSFSNSANFTPVGNPVAGDTVIVNQISAGGIDAGNFFGSTLASLQFTASVDSSFYVGTVSGAFEINASQIVVGMPTGTSGGQGPGRIVLNTGSVNTNMLVLSAPASGLDAGYETVRWVGSAAGNEITAQSGILGIGTNSPTDTANVQTLNLFAMGGGNAPTVNVGPGVAIGTINQSGGNLSLQSGSATTTINQSNGSLTCLGSGAITTLSAGGNCRIIGPGTITTLNVLAGGSVDLSGCPGCTITTINLYAGATISLNRLVTVTNPINLVECGVNDVTINAGPNVTATVAWL